ncbi:MAG: hypothetical protein MRZ79_11835 [Bacteroidia bacterium]|nr:hypothetical protein [Bacteroidia bacterium]
MKNFVCLILSLAFLLSNSQVAYSQAYIKDLSLRMDTSAYSWSLDKINFQNREVLPIVYASNNPTIELQIDVPKPEDISKIILLSQSGFALVDSLEIFNNAYFVGKIQLENSAEAGIKNIALRVINKQNDSINLIYPILPTIPANISIPPKDYLLLVGEVSQIPLLTDFPANIKSFNTWKRNSNYAYRIIKKDGQNSLEIIPFEAKTFEVRLNIECVFPHLVNNKVRFYQRLETMTIIAKRGSLKFLDLDLDDVLVGRNEKSTTTALSFKRPLELDINKVYRLEAGEESGSKLIAEFFTKKLLPNGKIQGTLTAYDYHNREAGPLYIKNGNKAVFQTNVNIIPKATISSILVDGKKSPMKYWVGRPGEKIKLSWEGESIDKANWTIEGKDSKLDFKQIKMEPTKAEIEVSVPKNIKAKVLQLKINDKNSGYYIKVEEWNRPQELSFISLGFPGKSTKMYGNKMIKRPYYFDQLEDADITFYPQNIEKQELLFGPQYMNIEFTLLDPENRVLERKNYQQIGIKPGKHSARHAYYNDKQLWEDTTLKVEKVFKYSIEELPAWSKIQIDIAHDTAKYDTGLKKIQFNLILRRKLQFNVELGIPVGVMSNNPDHENGTQIDGASIFLMGQLGFYQRNKINKLQKFRLGAGIVALNALNFRRSNRVDLGVGTMLQLYPTSQNSKISVPLYVGGGYAITRNYWFFYSGAGVSVRLN